jgi:very-short-patch-repair endonuclease
VGVGKQPHLLVENMLMGTLTKKIKLIQKENPPTPQLCECSCGKLASVKRRYIKGHYSSSLNKKKAQLCACGTCSEFTTPGRDYLTGHNPRTQFFKDTESYPEMCFREFLESLGAIKGVDFVQEHQAGKYRLDFSYVDEKRYIEIDGGQHLLPEAIEHDRIRDVWFEKQGWIGIRLPVKGLYSLIANYTDGVIDKT